jgi:ferric-dicitrate binding protein FerR (iron transport regulator)
LIIARKKLFIPLLAALLLIFSIPYIWKAINPSEKSQQVSVWEKISVAHGAQKELTLADGSRIILDAGSYFQYPLAFRGKTREVFLNGEGYFEVKPDKKKTFTVNANHAVIKVVGTKFNVQAWPSNQKVDVAVIEGEVSLGARDADSTSAVVISRGELSTLAVNGQPSAPREVDVEKHLGWLNREIGFHNTSLQQILTLLERWYDIYFVWDESVSVSDQLTIHILNRPVDEIIELIADLTNLGYKREGKTVYLFTQKNNR